MLSQPSLFDLPIDFICFGSGSSGNCYLLRHGQCAILIDMGVGIRRFQKYFNSYGFKLPNVQAAIITHDHMDHTRAAGALSRKLHWPIYATLPVHAGIDKNPVIKQKIPADHKRIITHGEPFEIGPFKITAFPVPHDASDNSGYFITCGSTSICIITDAGSITPEMRHYVHEAQHLIVEANYDAEMLRTGPYPYHLQERIRGGRGHLCNDECAHLLRECIDPAKIKNLWLCHLSQENNTPAKAQTTIQAALEDLHLPCQPQPLRRIEPTGPYVLGYA